MSENKQQRRALKEEKSWQKLQDLYNKHGTSLSMKQLFAEDGNRFATYSHRLATKDGEILFDFSKNIINAEILNSLFDLVS